MNLQKLEKRLLLDAAPSVTLTVDDKPFINEPTQIEVVFDNTDDEDTGFAPYVDVTLPKELELQSTTVYGVEMEPIILLDGEKHPHTDEVFTAAKDGDRLLVFDLPFGSVAPKSPNIPIILKVVPSDTEGVDAAISKDIEGLTAQGFFYETEHKIEVLDSDPISKISKIVTPHAIKISYESDLHEQENATGENFTFNYSTVVDIANGVEVKDLLVTDTIPEELKFFGEDLSAIRNGDLSSIITFTDSEGEVLNPEITILNSDGIPVWSSSDNELNSALVSSDDFYKFEFNFGDITGTLNNKDITINYSEVFIKEKFDDDNDASTAEIDVLGNGEETYQIIFGKEEQAKAVGTTTQDGTDLSLDAEATTMTISAEAIAVQKSVSQSEVAP